MKKWWERDHARHAAKLLVKDKLLHSGKVPVNAELRSLRKEKKERKFSDTTL